MVSVWKKYERQFLLGLVVAFFLLGYNIINSFTVGRNAFTLLTYIDEIIPFEASFILIYNLAFFVAILPLFFVKNRIKFRNVAYSYFLVTSMTFFIFLVFPVKMIRPWVEPTNFLNNIVLFVYSIDLSYNAFPSLHVVYPFLAGMIIIKENIKWGFLVVLLAFIIALSTLFVKQHYLLDVLGGFLIAALGFLVYRYLSSRSLKRVNLPPARE